MAGDEDEAEEVVADVLSRLLSIAESRSGEVCSSASSSWASSSCLRSATRCGGRDRWRGVCGCGKPCADYRDAGLRPLFECGDECLLREVFGEADVAGEACESGDDARRLDAPYGFDGAVQSRCGSVADTATDHTRFNPWMQERLFVGGLIWQLSSALYFVLDLLFGQDRCEVFHLKDWRISTSESPAGLQLGARLTHSMASSRDLTCKIEKPAMSSLAR